MKYGPSEEYKSHVDFYDRDTRFFGNDVTKFGAHRKLLKVCYIVLCTFIGRRFTAECGGAVLKAQNCTCHHDLGPRFQHS